MWYGVSHPQDRPLDKLVLKRNPAMLQRLNDLVDWGYQQVHENAKSLFM